MEYQKELQKRLSDVRKKDEWTREDFVNLVLALDGPARKKLIKDLIAFIEDTATDSTQAGNEILFLKRILGRALAGKVTTRDLGKAWGRSHVGVLHWGDEVEGNFKKALRDATGENDSLVAMVKLSQTDDEQLKKRFVDIFNDLMNAHQIKSDDKSVDPEREARKRQAKVAASAASVAS